MSELYRCTALGITPTGTFSGTARGWSPEDAIAQFRRQHALPDSLEISVEVVPFSRRTQRGTPAEPRPGPGAPVGQTVRDGAGRTT
jgi:hypothetical protein